MAAPVNDNIAQALLLGLTQSGNSAEATTETNESTSTGVSSVWYVFVAPSTQSITIDTRGSAIDTILTVFRKNNDSPATSVSNLTQVASNDDIVFSDDLDSSVTLTVTQNVTYYVKVGGFGGTTFEPSAGPFVLNSSVASAPVLPSLAVDDAQVTELDTTGVSLSFVVRREGDLSRSSTVNYTFANPITGAALTAADFAGGMLPAGGTITFAATEDQKTVTLTIAGDYAIEGSEGIVINLSGVAGATISDNSALGTVFDTSTDVAGTVSIGSAEVTEGDTASVGLSYGITRSNGLGDVTFTVSTTTGGSATAGTDYTETTTNYAYRSNVLYVITGTSQAPIFTAAASFVVPVLGDREVESSETVNVRLSSAAQPNLTATATGTITDND
ncbi:MAG: hypothetical protein EOO38_15005, partial [Cytophagaceae bacterium]